MEPVSPMFERQELRLKMPERSSGEVTLYLVAQDAGDGSEHDIVVWNKPRLVAPGRPDLLLRDVRGVASELAALRRQAVGAAARCLDAAARATAAKGRVDVDALAKRHGVEHKILAAWLDYLGIGTDGAAVRIDTHLRARIENSSGYDFIKGWGSPDLPIVVANSSGQSVRIPGSIEPHSVAMHPTPSLRVAAGWCSPVSVVLQIAGQVQHAHPECGNGVTWSLELRRGAVRQKLAAGIAHGATAVKVGPVKDVAVQPGDLVSLVIGPRDGNHSCDLTAINLTLDGGNRGWNLCARFRPTSSPVIPMPTPRAMPESGTSTASPKRTTRVMRSSRLARSWQRGNRPAAIKRRAGCVERSRTC